MRELRVPIYVIRNARPTDRRFVGALVFSFGKRLGYFFLVVGRETHRLLCSAASRVEIVMAMTQRAYAQYVHIHGNKKNKTQGDKISDDA